MSIVWAVWRFIRNLLAGVIGWCADALRWALMPANRVKALAIVLGVLAGWAFLQSYRANQRVIVVTGERDSAVAKTAAVEAVLAEEREGWLAFKADWATQQRAHAAALEAARKEAQDADAKNEADKAKARKSHEGWQSVYRSRDEACKAALETLDAACPYLKGY